MKKRLKVVIAVMENGVVNGTYFSYPYESLALAAEGAQYAAAGIRLHWMELGKQKTRRKKASRKNLRKP